MKTPYYFGIVFLCTVFNCRFVSAETPIKVLYTDRPPFMKKQADGTLTGYAAQPAIRAFAKAEIPFELEEASPARRLFAVKENVGRVCSIGLYKTAERISFARFSSAVSQDGRMVGVANIKFQIAKSITVNEILDRRDLHILLKKDIFYGQFLESRFAKMKAQRIASTAEYPQLMRLIKLDRAQLIFLPEEEAAFYLKEFGYSTSDFNIIHFPEMPPGELRYIMCSLSVEESVIAKLNKAIGEFRH